MFKKRLQKNPHRLFPFLPKRPILKLLTLIFISFAFNVGGRVYACSAAFTLKTFTFYSTMFSYERGFVNTNYHFNQNICTKIKKDIKHSSLNKKRILQKRAENKAHTDMLNVELKNDKKLLAVKLA